MLLGSSIDPSLFSNDYSGFANAGAIRGQATAQLGKDIAGAATNVASGYVQMKQAQGQTDAFKKSMDAMAKAFPSQADMFNKAGMEAMDPNASLIERLSRMNAFKDTFQMVQQQKTMNMNEQFKNYQMSGAGQAAAGGAASTDAWNKAAGTGN
jgi:hypothetical protein